MSVHAGSDLGLHCVALRPKVCRPREGDEVSPMLVREKKVTDSILKRARGTPTGKVSPIESLDFNVFGAKEIRDLLKNKAHCLRAGFPPDHLFITILNEIRNHYILKVGLSTYLSQMLGALGGVRIDRCTLYSEDCHPIQVDLKGNRNQPIQRFIAKQLGLENLPFMVEVRGKVDPDQIEVRYL